MRPDSSLALAVGRSSDLAALPPWASALIDASPVARLGMLADDGAPRVQPVTYAVSGGTLVTAVDHKPKRVSGGDLARIRWLRANPRATLTIDHYESDWAQLAWVQAVGTVQIAEAGMVPDAIAALVARYEPYRTRVPEGPVLVLRPDFLVWWRAAG
jgi:PPOX class probable F420-dependent enzyme